MVLIGHLVEKRAHEGIRSLSAEEPLSVVQEDLVETVEDVLEQERHLLFPLTRLKQGITCGMGVIKVNCC